MSGGALDYAYGRVRDTAYELIRQSTNSHQKALGRHLLLIAEALHDVEWVLSGDYAEGDEIDAIQKVLPEHRLLDSVLEDARVAYLELGKLLKEHET
jgi:hypothetical protein